MNERVVEEQNSSIIRTENSFLVSEDYKVLVCIKN